MFSLVRYSLLITGLLASISCFAQFADTTNDFVRYERTIFYEDFSRDAVGGPPRQWILGPTDEKSINRWFKVQRNNEGTYLSVLAWDYSHSNCFIERKMDELNYIPDSFTLELDFMLESPKSKIDLDFYSSTMEEVFKLIFHTQIKGAKRGFNFEYCRWYSSYNKDIRKLPSDFSCRSWHHLALSYAHGKLKCYLDQERLLVKPGHDHPLSGFLVSFITPADIKNIRLATGKKKEPKPLPPVTQITPVPVRNNHVQSDNPLNKIITEKKFVTHAINFDINKSVIKPESMPFIMSLTEFLKENPSIKLEIDGHTDSDGDSLANMLLSRERAEAVKAQLMTNGIDGTRLTTNGYGATKPMAPNTTPENKAENRRVEFIKK